MSKKPVPKKIRKLTISGSLVEIMRFSQPRLGVHRKFTDEEKKKRREMKIAYNTGALVPDVAKIEPSLHRASTHLKRLVCANAWQWKDKHGITIPAKFLTLTFKENITSLKDANRYLSKYIQRLNDKYEQVLAQPIKYVCVPEFQERGAVHYHLVLFNFPFVDRVYSELRKVWGGHRIELKTLDRRNQDVWHIISYISKYLTKQSTDGRFWGQKRYFTSNGLLKPIVLRDDIAIELVRQSIAPYKKFEKVFEVPYVGDIQYWSYYLGDDKHIYSRWLDPYAKEQIELARKKFL